MVRCPALLLAAPRDNSLSERSCKLLHGKVIIRKNSLIQQYINGGWSWCIHTRWLVQARGLEATCRSVYYLCIHDAVSAFSWHRDCTTDIKVTSGRPVIAMWAKHTTVHSINVNETMIRSISKCETTRERGDDDRRRQHDKYYHASPYCTLRISAWCEWRPCFCHPNRYQR